MLRPLGKEQDLPCPSLKVQAENVRPGQLAASRKHEGIRHPAPARRVHGNMGQ